MKIKTILRSFFLTTCLITSAQEQENKELLFEYSISYGSRCCPKDLKWDEKQSIESGIKAFEKKHAVLMKGTLMAINGKEGERTYYFSFFNWTAILKNKFLNTRSDFHKLDKIATLDSIKKRVPEKLIKKLN